MFRDVPAILLLLMASLQVSSGVVDEPSPPAIQWHETNRWKGLGPIGFRLAELPDDTFLLLFPEWIVAREKNWHVNTQWTKTKDSAVGKWQDGDYSLVIRLKYRRDESESILAWECEFKNGSTTELTDVAAFNCFNLVEAPLFQDLKLDRSWVGDGKRNRRMLAEIPQTKGPRPLQFYPARGGIELVGFERYAVYQATNKTELSGDRIGVVSRDGRWTLENIVDGPVAFFFNNAEPDHGCLHASPLLGNIAAGQIGRAKGRIVLKRSTKE